MHNTFAHLIHVRKILFPVKILKLLRTLVPSEKLRCLHQVKYFKAHKSDAHSSDHSLDTCLAVCLCDKLGGTLVEQKSLLPMELGVFMDKKINGLQNCIDSFITEEDLSYLILFCQLLIFIGLCSLQSSFKTVYYSRGFEIMNVC